MLYLCSMDKKVYATLTWVTLAVVMINAKLVPLTEEALLSNFIQQYVQPYVEAQTNVSKFHMRYKDKIAKQRLTHEYKDIFNYISDKVDELKPFLQDDTVSDNFTLVGDKQRSLDDNKLSLEEDDETTIIEFIPKLRDNTKIDEEVKLIETKAKDFQENLQKYKKLRSKIRKALKRENITKKTKNLITNTLDKMIAQMIAHRCTWTDSLRMRALLKSDDSEKGADIAKSWNAMWQKLKHQYKSANLNEKSDAELQKDIFLTKFQDLVSVMTSDLNTMVSKYKVVCHLKSLHGKDDTDNTRFKSVKRSEEEKPHLRGENSQSTDIKTAAENAILSNKFDDKLPCNNFRICSEELRYFLLDLYITLNETTVNTINNYAAMFLRDVSDDGYHEKERVVNLIHAISKTMQKKIDLGFRKQIKKLKLDRNKNKHANMKILNDLVSNLISRVKKSTHKQTEIELKSLRGKLISNIQKDIDVNMELDLGNLERDIISGTCEIFEICNGKVFTRKTSYIDNKDTRNVYVNFQLNLEEEDKIKETTTADNPTQYKQFRVIISKSPLKYNVTRTRPTVKLLEIRTTDDANDEDNLITEPRTTPNVLEIVKQNSKHQKKVLDFIEAPSVTVKITLVEDKKDKDIKPEQDRMKRKRSYLRRMFRAQMNMNTDETTTRETPLIYYYKNNITG